MRLTAQSPSVTAGSHGDQVPWRHVIGTKLRVPTHAGAQVTRDKLIQRLEAIRAVRLVMLRAPAGYGKTTLATQWRHVLLEGGDDTRVVWLNLDAGDNEPLRFCTYLIEALAHAEVLSGQRLLSVLEGGVEQVDEYVLPDLVNRISAHAGNVWLVFEDWHLIEDQRVHGVLAFLLQHAPENLHLLVTSRKRLPLALSRLRMEGQMKEFGARDLRFDAAESQQFVREINALPVSVQSVESLWRTTDGWIAGLQLASLSMRSSDDPEQVLAGLTDVGAQRSIGEYLAENVVDSLPPETLDFLLRTSILAQLCAPLCAAVSGRADSQRILETLERHDLFISALDSERDWFRYHHLFQSYLRRRLDREHPGLAVSLERAACEWFAAAGHTDEAVAHALAAGAEDRAIELVERDAMGLVEDSRMATLLGLIGRLPARRLVDRPHLQIAIAWAHALSHHPDDAERALGHVEDSLTQADADPDAEEALRGEVQLVRGTNEAYSDRIERIEPLTRPCLEHADQWRPWLTVVAVNVLSYRFLHIAQFDRAREVQSWGSRFHTRTRGPFSAVYGLCIAGMAAVEQGALDVAAVQFQTALKQARAGAGRHSHAARLAGALWGRIQYEHNQLQAAEDLLEESRALGAEGGVVDFSIATYVTLARLRAATGDVAAAHQRLDEGEETARRLHFRRLAAALAGERVRLYLCEGAIQQAARVVAAFDGTEDCPGPPGIEAQVCEYQWLAQARMACARGEPVAAAQRLRKLVQRAHANGRWLMETTLRLPLARALDAAGDHDAVRQTLVEALEAGARQGLVRSFVDEQLLPLLMQLRTSTRREASNSPLSSDAQRYLDTLIAAAEHDTDRGRVPDAVPAESSMAVSALLVEPLTEREAQTLRLLAKGCSNKEIARTLGVSVNTVKWHLKSLYSKLCVNRRTQAVAAAKRLGLVS